MKTLTEFASPTLKSALEKKAELTSSGKTPEELPAAMGEALKLEGDKLTHLLGALEVVGEKLHDLKRVIVSSLNEGEKAPSGAKLVGEKYYSIEYYPPIGKGGPAKQDFGRDRDSRDGKGGRGGKGGKRGGPGGGRGDGRGGDRPSRDAGAPGGDRGPRAPRDANAGGGGGQGPRAPRAPRPPRPMTPTVPYVPGNPPVKPLIKPIETKPQTEAAAPSTPAENST